jgi:serine/threonine protein kinase
MDAPDAPPYPDSVHDLPYISRGVSSLVYQLSPSAVIKTPCGLPNSHEQLVVEHTIYKRLGPHPHITKLLGTYRDKIILERLQFPLRKRLWDLRDAGRVPPKPDVLRWAAQIALGLQHLHSRGVLQVDVGPHNVLLDWDDNAKLSDFAGSSIDGSRRLVCPGRRAEHPDIPAGAPSVRSEIFALGSTLYELETTRQPYHDRDDREVHRLFLAGDFPDTAPLVLGGVMRKCWASKYACVGDVVRDIQSIGKSDVGSGCVLNGFYARAGKGYAI